VLLGKSMAGPRRPRAHDVAFFMPQIGPLFTRDEASGVAPGGAEVQIAMLARELARRGLRVAVIALEQGLDLPDVVDGVHVIPIASQRHRRKEVRRLSAYAAVARAVLAVRTHVLVQRNAAVETGLLALLAPVGGFRFAYSSANVIDFDFGSLEPSPTKVRLFELGVRRADVVIVQTTEQVELCTSKFRRGGTLIRSIAEPAAPTAVDPEAFLWVGRLAQYKRPEVFVELARRVPEARFRMVALRSSHEPPEVTRMLEDARRELPNLEVLPSRPRAELGELIAAAVAVVNTSEYEGMSNVILEGWVRGVPAIAFTHDPDGLIERHGLGVCAHGSEEALLEAVCAAWERRHTAERPNARCVSYVEREHALAPVAGAWTRALGLEAPCAG
jgi:glycosyltransferase involved in cell wall biosynthesis